MIELSELEEHVAEFKKRAVRVIVVSNDNLQSAQMTQADFPNLLIVADSEQHLARALGVVHLGAAPDGGNTSVPSTFIFDRNGFLRWFYRSERFISRLSAEELLAAIDDSIRD